MPDDLINFPPEALASGHYLPPEMVQDLRAVAAVDTNTIDSFIKALTKETGVLTEERVEDLTKQFFNEDEAQSVSRTIQNLEPEFKQKFLGLVDRWRQINDEGKHQLPDAEFAALQRNLDALVQDYPGLTLMRKAQRLLRDTGNEIKDLIFICDLRPVFDKPQERVEGFVALATLRVRYFRQSGQRDAFEIALTEDELKTLVEQGEKALSKLKVLKETAREVLK